MPTSSDVQEFYDAFSSYEAKSGINLRHYSILNKLVASGLRPYDDVLEMGCGIGQLSFLLHRYLRKGKLVSIDISPESVNMARQRIPASSRVEFFVANATTFSYPAKFDFIVLPDVLEHIPEENHALLFNNLSDFLVPGGTLVIHVPYPDIINYEKTHNPGILQIIDQALQVDILIQHGYAGGLRLKDFNAYSLYHKQEDYVFIIFKKTPILQYNKYRKRKIIWKKSINRLRYWINLIFQ